MAAKLMIGCYVLKVLSEGITLLICKSIMLVFWFSRAS